MNEKKINKKDINTIRESLKKQGNIPNHIAIIMDGNGRWAKQRKRPRVFGHNEGINSVRAITEECGKLGVNYLTLYTFSTENWSRPKDEVTALMRLLLKTIRKEIDKLNKNNVKLSLIGHTSDLPEKSLKALMDGADSTRNNTGLNLNLALSYSSRQEILDAVKNISTEIKHGNYDINNIDEKLFSEHLYTGNKPDPDLLIRTSGEMRLSNFLLWQLAYSEIYVTPVLWPDFRNMELFDAIIDYQKRERRFGKTSEQITKES